MDWDDPKPKPVVAVGDNLADQSVADLRAEIDRIKDALHVKQSTQTTADDFFKR